MRARIQSGQRFGASHLMRLWLLLTVAVCLCFPSVRAADENATAATGRWAILIGVAEYTGLTDLHDCGRDQLTLRNQLVACGFPEHQVFLLNDDAEQPQLGNKPGDVIANSIGMKLVVIPAGEFLMGSPESEAKRSPDEGPQHRVQITQQFLMGQYEVTQGEWQAVMGTNPSWFAASGTGNDKIAGMDASRFPVETVSWYDAAEFCNKLSAHENLSPYYALTNIERNKGSIKSATVSVTGGRGYRLPTEAEWEYSCRAGTTTPFDFGATSNGREANISGNFPAGTQTKGPYLERTTAVGSYVPNKFGLYDLHGNVWEWCADWYDANAYQGRTGTTRDPLAESGEREYRVQRGGAWYSGAWGTRSAMRGWHTPGNLSSLDGFRLARTP